MNFFKLCKSKRLKNIKLYKEKGAIIVDVRTSQEYKQNHAPNTISIPLDTLALSIDKVKNMNKPIIVVCHSGVRAASAKRLLAKNNIEVINGKSWRSVID